MTHIMRRVGRWGGVLLLLAFGLVPTAARAQDDAGPPPVIATIRSKVRSASAIMMTRTVKDAGRRSGMTTLQ